MVLKQELTKAHLILHLMKDLLILQNINLIKLKVKRYQLVKKNKQLLLKFIMYLELKDLVILQLQLC